MSRLASRLNAKARAIARTLEGTVIDQRDLVSAGADPRGGPSCPSSSPESVPCVLAERPMRQLVVGAIERRARRLTKFSPGG